MSISSGSDVIIGQDDPASLTELEKVCLSLTASGMTPDNISAHLGMPATFIDDILDRTEIKLRAKNRFHAVCLAISMGFVSTES